MFLQSEAKSRLAAQIAAKYDWRSPNRHATGDNRPKPSFLNTINQVNSPLKVGTHDQRSPCDWSLQLAPWGVYMRGLVAGTCLMNSSHEAFWGTSRKDLSQKFKPVWICGTSRRDQILVPPARFCGKMASSHDGTCPCDLFQGLVAGTTCSPLVCADLYNFCSLLK